MTNRYTGLSGLALVEEEIKESREILANSTHSGIHAEIGCGLVMLLQQREKMTGDIKPRPND